MSKGDSHLFQGTSGAGKALIDEVISNGEKISPDKVVMITKTASGRIIWLEEGNKFSGLQHIIDKHGHEFYGKGLSKEDIPNYILEAVYQDNIIGTQGKRTPPRSVYEFVYNGKTQRIAVQVGSNGYVVSANTKSMKEI
jgi:filamentous hemagglutinin